LTHRTVNSGNLHTAPSILLVTGKPELRDTIERKLSPTYDVCSIDGPRGCLERVKTERFGCVLVDIDPNEGSTSSLLRAIKSEIADLPVLVLCTTPDISSAVEAIRAGAADFIIKEVEIDGLAKRIAKLLGESPVLDRCVCGTAGGARSWKPGRMVVGNSPRMNEIMRRARKVAMFPVPVLLLGESGTGKELLARWFHRNSGRADGPFVALNLAAIPTELVESTLFGHDKGAFTGAAGPRDGKFSQAQGGTLMLDEITEFKVDLQPKLLRVLQENEFERVGGDRTYRTDARIIAATNRDIEETVQSGAFRSDLFYRLNVVTITLPPLRERRDDIPELAEFFLEKYNRTYGCSVIGFERSAMETLQDQDWPGNIRELENTVQRAVICTVEGCVERASLECPDTDSTSKTVQTLADQRATLEDLERCYINEVLQRTDGHQGNAAKILGIDRKTLYNKLLKYGIGRASKQSEDRDRHSGKLAC